MQDQQYSLFKGYFDKGSNHEALKEQLKDNDSWNNMYDAIIAMGKDGLIAMQKEIDWNLSENGITYNVYNDPKGLNRPWSLNVLPFAMNSSEWELVEKGLKQRATLLDLVAKDIYGKRELIKNGVIPSEVVFAHRGFLRQCDGIPIATEKYLSVYAADLSRGPDGRMWVVSDRTQAPSGMGYSLENRTVAGRVLNAIYHESGVQDQSDFFQNFNRLLFESAPSQKPNPTIVVLTPGPHNETYFEHAFLASQYGYPLVRGSDLVVRNGKLWMKSLKELKQVDVVYRRVDDVFVDPLELFEDSYLGVAGLLDVVRSGNVTIINPIGIGVLENSGLIPFMSAIANYFLKEELMLPQIATWWCGQENEREHVLQNIKSLVIKRIDRSNRESIVFAEFLSQNEIDNLKAKINKRPHLYVAQERISFSTVPNFTNEKIEPRNMVCRAFAVAKNEEYEVMKGGLVRVSPSREQLHVSNQRGGTSKDFCVLNPDHRSIRPSFEVYNKHIRAATLNDLPSLTAENLFWAGRYIGRVLVTSRHLRMVLRYVENKENTIDLDKDSTLSILLQSLTHLTNTYPGFVGDEKHPKVTDVRKELLAVALDVKKEGSLAFTISMFNNAYYSIRNLWSADMWRVFESIQKIWSEVQSREADKMQLKELIKMLDKLITRLIAFMGLIEESILVEQGLLLYFIGLNIEKVTLMTTNFQSTLSVVYDDQTQYEILEALLQSNESSNIYRYTYRSYVNMESFIELLLLDTKYARSLTQLINRLKKDVVQLPHSVSDVPLQEYERPVLEAVGRLQQTSIEELMKISDEQRFFRSNLNNLLSALNDLIYQTSKAISDVYFNHVDDQNQLIRQQFN